MSFQFSLRARTSVRLSFVGQLTNPPTPLPDMPPPLPSLSKVKRSCEDKFGMIFHERFTKRPVAITLDGYMVKERGFWVGRKKAPPSRIIPHCQVWQGGGSVQGA